MNDFSSVCFVCGHPVDPSDSLKNEELNLPVCMECRGSEREKQAISELRDGMAEGFVCGCI
ncbi:hypothetical protein N2K84_05240 [Prolixibacteraceae bacterium A06]|uniref:Uncharacterized protein n=2 Tax=Gaoshiqia sediminis TaxID=2986998 RepID=A0AA41YA77_9BACT|nr:hypothetical protein [Gaoshiqia sediminis]